MLMHNEIRQSITNSIVEHLESGKVAPWRRPWTLDRNAGAPANIVSKRNYSGINPLVLEVASMRYGFQSKWWATFNQWKQLGGRVMRRPENVKPGQWATNIVFWKPITRTETDANGYEREEKYYLLKTFHVFCVDQVEGKHLDHLRVGHADAKLAPDEVEARYSSAEAAIQATGADIRHGGNGAYYRSEGDYIVLPHRHQFGVAEYYETAFHELAHWTEHASRLNWDRSKPENSYALGELIAELGGCFIAVALGVPTAERLENHASYLNGWLENMKSDPKFIFAAAAQAAKAADFVLSFSREPVEEREPAIVF